MLKKIYIRGKEIPVPVPLLTLKEAIEWINATFVNKECVVTSVNLNGVEVDQDYQDLNNSQSLRENSILEVIIETPKDLSIQTLDAVRDLSFEVNKQIKHIAIRCWKLEEETHLKELFDIIKDLNLVLELIEHINGMVDYTHEDLAPINGIARLLKRTLDTTNIEVKQCHWKKASIILINRIEPLLKDMVNECESLQISIYSIGVVSLNEESVNAS